MPKIYRALARETLAIFFATLLILLAIILSFRLSNLLASAGRGDIALGAVAQLIAMQALRFLILLAPLSFVLAAMMALGRMHQDLEISALLASGIGYGHQLRALLLTAFPLPGAPVPATVRAAAGLPQPGGAATAGPAAGGGGALPAPLLPQLRRRQHHLHR